MTIPFHNPDRLSGTRVGTWAMVTAALIAAGMGAIAGEAALLDSRAAAIVGAWNLLAGAAGATALCLLYRRRGRRAGLQRARLAALVEGSADAIVGLGLDGKVTDWNPAAERMFGYAARDAVGHGACDLFVPAEDQAMEARLLARVVSGELVPPFESRRLRRDGRVLHVAITASPLRDVKGRVVGASKTLRDITQKVEAARALEEAQARRAHAARSAGVGLWDWQTSHADPRWDDSTFAAYGQPREDFEHDYESRRALVHPDDLESTELAIRDALETGNPIDVTFRIRTPKGETRYIRGRGAQAFDASGRPVGQIGASIDITEEKRRELEIEALNAELERQVANRTAELRALTVLQGAVLANAAHGIVATDAAGVCTVFNPAAERIYGYRADEIIGRPMSMIPHDEAEMAARAAQLSAELGRPVEPGLGVFAVKAGDGGVDTHEWTCIAKDGTRRPVLLSTSKLRRGDGEDFGYLSIVVDLSERVEQERAIRESETFLKAITDHTPCMVSYWGADLRCRFANEAYKIWFGKSGAEMVGVHFGDLGGGELIRLNDAQIQGVLRGEAQSFARQLTKADGVVGHVWCHYIPDVQGGEVRGYYVFVSDITDLTQAQTALEALNRALEDRNREAEAAALANSRVLADASHDIRSPMNAIMGIGDLLAGTTLTAEQDEYVRILRRSGETLLSRIDDILDPSRTETAPAPPKPAAADVAPKALRILMVEDSDDSRAVTLAYMEDMPYRVDVAATGAIACEMFTKGRYDLVLMDRRMPVMDGLTATRAMRAWEKAHGRRPTPIIALTASTLKGDREICMAAGCTAYLSKPIRQEVLLRAITDHTPRRPVPYPTRPPSNRVKARVAPPSSADGARPTVLIVDCIRRNVAMMRALLGEREFRVRSVRDIGGALDLIRRERPDLVVANTHLREEEGADLLRAIRADPTLPPIPFVFITASQLRASDEAVAAELDAGITSPDAEPAELRAQLLAWLPPRSPMAAADQPSAIGLPQALAAEPPMPSP